MHPVLCVCGWHGLKCLQTRDAGLAVSWLASFVSALLRRPACAKGNRWALFLQLDPQMLLELRALKNQRHRNLSVFQLPAAAVPKSSENQLALNPSVKAERQDKIPGSSVWSREQIST